MKTVGKRNSKKIAVTVIVSLAVLLAAFMGNIVPSVQSAYTGAAKPMEFYLHYLDVPVTVAGLQTKYVMNTTREFRFLTQQDAYDNSFYKPVGLPKIAVDFYLYPNFAGPVTINGSWQTFLWANASALKPVGFTLTFTEITVDGTVLWSSGQTNPTVTSTVGEYLDVPVYNYNLSTPLSHAFSPGTTLLVDAEVNAGSSADTRIWYDSPLYPSKVILPAEDYARPVSVKTYAVDNSETAMFYYNWTEDQRKVIVRANVTDPFGGYDIYRVNLTIYDPTGNPVIDNVDMIRVSDGQWTVNYAHIFEANWSYPDSAQRGDYSVIVTVIDNNGYYRYNDTGAFDPFIEENTYTFTIGAIVFYDPVFLVTDDMDNPLPNAQVYVTWLNGTTDTVPRYTSDQGTISLTRVQAGNYSFTILWKDVIVQHTTVFVDSDGPYTIKTQVYELTVQVLGNDGLPVHGAYVIAYTESGVGYGLGISDSSGRAVFSLPSGTYRIEAYYTSDYWLTVVRTSATETVPVTASTTQNMVLREFPPAIWLTIGFWLMMGIILAVGLVGAFVFYITYVRTPKVRRTPTSTPSPQRNSRRKSPAVKPAG